MARGFLDVIAQPAAAPPPPAGNLFSDDFNRADSTVIDGGSVSWTEWDMAETTTTVWEISGNKLRNPNAGYMTALAGDTGSADHWAECEVGALSGVGTAIIGPVVRATSDGGEGYILTAWTDRCRLYYFSGGTLATITDWGSGDFTGSTIALEVSGTTLTGYADGVQIGTTTDATYSTGQYVGVMGRNSATVDNFEADSGAYTATGPVRSWFTQPTRTIFQPVGSGSNVNVSNATALDTALTNAVPGDCINLATGEYGVFRWQANPAQSHASGTAGNPITVQAQAGATVTFTGPSTGSGNDVLRLEDVDYFRLSGLDVSTGLFATRIFSCTNGEILNCKFHNTSDSLLALQYQSRVTGTLQAGDPCSNILIEGCEFYDSGQINSQFGEGLYLGKGSAPFWDDECHDIEVRHCHFHDLTADAVDIKPGCYNIDIHHCDFHDIEQESGAVISGQCGALTSGDAYDPKASTLERVTTIHHNRFWNIRFVLGGPAFGITFGHGGEDVYNNLFWGFNPDANSRALNLRHLQDASDYAVNIYNNTIWVDNSINKAYDGTAPGGGVNIWDNITQDGAAGSTETISSGADQVSAAVFLGPVPTVNTSGSAIGTGQTEPGSAFLPDTATSIPATTGTPPADDLTDISRPQGAQTEKGALEHL